MQTSGNKCQVNIWRTTLQGYRCCRATTSFRTSAEQRSCHVRPRTVEATQKKTRTDPTKSSDWCSKLSLSLLPFLQIIRTGHQSHDATRLWFDMVACDNAMRLVGRRYCYSFRHFMVAGICSACGWISPRDPAAAQIVPYLCAGQGPHRRARPCRKLGVPLRSDSRTTTTTTTATIHNTTNNTNNNHNNNNTNNDTNNDNINPFLRRPPPAPALLPGAATTANLFTKILYFRGFDSSMI